MAYEIAAYATKITLVAGADLSAKQYLLVKLDANGKAVVCSGATDVPIGVLQNAPSSGQEAEVVVVGGTKIVAGGTINEGELIGTDANAKADTKVPGTDTTNYVIGQAVTAGAANNIITAVINCAAPHRAA